MSTVETLPIVSDHPATQARYEELRAAGESHKMADLLAHQQFPGTKGTDRTFLEGRQTHDQFGDSPVGRAMGDYYRQKAIEAGVNPHGKVYLHGLATKVADPTAWVSDASDVKRVAREKNLHVSGAVEHVATDVDVPVYPLEGPYKIDDRLVEEDFQKAKAADPDLAHATPEKQAEARHALKERMSGRG